MIYIIYILRCETHPTTTKNAPASILESDEHAPLYGYKGTAEKTHKAQLWSDSFVFWWLLLSGL
jgi:hypothetical protein